MMKRGTSGLPPPSFIFSKATRQSGLSCTPDDCNAAGTVGRGERWSSRGGRGAGRGTLRAARSARWRGSLRRRRTVKAADSHHDVTIF